MSCKLNGVEINNVNKVAANNNLDIFGNFSPVQMDNYINFLKYLHSRPIRHYNSSEKQFLTLSSFVNSDIYEYVRETTKNLLEMYIKNPTYNIPDSVKEDLKIIYDNYDSFIDFFYKKVNFSAASEAEQEFQKNEELKSRDQVTGNENSAWQSASIKTRFLFALLPQMENDGSGKYQVKLDPISNLPMMTDATKLFTNVMSVLSKKTFNDPDDFYQYFFSEKFKNRFPELHYLQELYNPLDSETTNTADEITFYQDMYGSFKKGYIGIYQGGLSRDENTKKLKPTFNKANKSNHSKILKDFTQNFITSQFVSENGKDYTTLNLIDYNKIVISVKTLPFNNFKITSNDQFNAYSEPKKEYEKEYEKVVDFTLNTLGIKLIDKVLSQEESLTYNKLKKAIYQSYLSNVLQKNKDGKLSIKPVYNPLNHMDTDGKKTFTAFAKAVREYISFYEEFTPEQASLMFTNPNGDIEYAISEANLMNDVLSEINKHKVKYGQGNTTGLYAKFPHLENNPYFKLLDYSNVIVGNYGGLVSEEFTAKTSDLPYDQKMLLDIASFNSKGITDIPRTSTSASYYFLDKENGQVFTKWNENDSWPEHIKQFIDVKSTKLFEDLEGLSEEELKEALMKEFSPDIAEVERIINKYNVDVDSNFAKSFVISSFINNLEITLLLFGDSTQIKDLNKRWKFVANTGRSVGFSSKVANYLSKQDSFQSKKDSQKKNNQSYVAEIHENLAMKTLQNEKLTSEIKSNIAHLNPKFSNEELEKANKLIDDVYKNLKIADGQAWMNLDSYRNYMMLLGRWDDHYQGSAYLYNLLKFKQLQRKVLNNAEEEKLKELTALITGKESSRYTLPVVKFKYSGYITNTNTEDNEPYIGIHKFSIAPILPSNYSSLKSSSMKMFLLMLENEIDYAMMQSANKGHKFEDNTNTKITNLSNKIIIDNNFLYEQIETDSDQKVLISMATQSNKLLFSKLYEYGLPISEKIGLLHNQHLDILNKMSALKKQRLYDVLGVDVNDNGDVFIKDFTKVNQKLKDQAVQQGVSIKTIQQLMVDENGQLLKEYEKSGVFSDTQKLLMGLIDKELRLWKITGSQYVQVSNAFHAALDFYKHNRTTNLTEPASVRISLSGDFLKLLKLKHPDGSKVETLERLNEALLNKRWKEKNRQSLTIIGFRIPTEGHNSMEHLLISQFLDPTSGNIIQLYDEIVGKAGSDFDIDKLNLYLPSLDDNGYYISSKSEERAVEKIEKLKRSITYILESIQSSPTVDESTLEKIKNIQEEYIDLLTDVDEFEEDDTFNFQKTNILNEVNSAYWFNQIDKALNKIKFNEKVILSNISIKKLTNDLINVYSETLSQPEVYTDLVLPNNIRSITDDIEKLNNDLGIPTKNEVLKGRGFISQVKNNLFKENNRVAASQLGIYARANTLFHQFNITGAEVNMGYHYKVVDSSEGEDNLNFGKRIPLNFWSNDEIQQLLDTNQLSKNEKGEYTTLKIGTDKDLKGNSISKSTQEGISAVVDIEKNEQYFQSGITDKNLSTFLFMRKVLKLEPVYIMAFLKVPSIIEFFNPSEKSEKSNLLNAISKYGENLEQLPFEELYHVDYNKIISLIKGELSSEEAAKININLLSTLKYLDEAVKDFDFVSMHFAQDTTKIQNQFQAQQELNIRKLLLEDQSLLVEGVMTTVKDKLFTYPSIEKLTKDTIYNVFSNEQFISELSKKVFPIIYSDINNKAFNLHLSNLPVRKKNDKLSYEKKILSQFNTAVIHTFGEYNGQKFVDYATNFMNSPFKITIDGETSLNTEDSLWNRYLKITEYKKFYKLQESNSFLRSLLVTKNTMVKGFEDLVTVDISKDTSNKASSDIMLHEFETLYKEANIKANEPFYRDLKSLLDGLKIAALYQGLHISGHYIYDVIPSQYTQSIEDAAWNRYNSLSNSNKQLFANRYIQSFVENNQEYKTKKQKKKIGYEKVRQLIEVGRLIKPYNIDGFSTTLTNSNPVLTDTINKAATQTEEKTISASQQPITIKKDDKSNWNIVNKDGMLYNVNTNKPLDEVKDIKLINKYEVKEASLNERMVKFPFNTKDYAAIINYKGEFKIVSLNPSSLGNEVYKQGTAQYNKIIDENPSIVELIEKNCK